MEMFCGEAGWPITVVSRGSGMGESTFTQILCLYTGTSNSYGLLDLNSTIYTLYIYQQKSLLVSICFTE